MKYDIGVLLDAGRTGAYQRWLVFLTALTIVFDGIDNQLLGVVIPTMMSEWGVARSAFAPVVSLGIAGMMVGGALAGIAGDRIGRRRALLASIAMFGAMTLAIAAVHDISTLGALRFLAGMGLGGAIPNAATLSAEFVPRAQRPMAVTATIVCVPLGAMLAGILGARALDRRLARVVRRRGRRSARRRDGAGAAVAGIAPVPGTSSGALAGARTARRKLGHQVSPDAAFEDSAERSGARADLVALRCRPPSRHDCALGVLLQLPPRGVPEVQLAADRAGRGRFRPQRREHGHHGLQPGRRRGRSRGWRRDLTDRVARRDADDGRRRHRRRHHAQPDNDLMTRPSLRS